MTILIMDRKILILKTFKTGSTSLHLYFEKLSKTNPNIKVANVYSGHQTLDDLNLIFPDRNLDFREFKVIAVMRYPVQYMNSVYNQFIFEKEKQAKSLKIIRPLDKINKKLGFVFFWFWFCVINRKKTNIVNANYRLLKSYRECKIVTIQYQDFKKIESIIPEFDRKEYKKYQAKNYTKRDMFDVIPKYFRKKIIKLFIREIDLIRCCDNYEEIFKIYN